MKFIFLNAPPRSGKDVIANYLKNKYSDIEHVKFATPLYESIREMFSLDAWEWFNMYNETKDIPSEKLMGMSPRQSMIWLSEEVIKPKFGKDFFGQTMVNKINGKYRDDIVFLSSDSGMKEEAIPVIEIIGVENCYHVQIDRPGCDFSNDSRSYWEPPEGVNKIKWSNDRSLEAIYHFADDLYDKVKLDGKVFS